MVSIRVREFASAQFAQQHAASMDGEQWLDPRGPHRLVLGGRVSADKRQRIAQQIAQDPPRVLRAVEPIEVDGVWCVPVPVETRGGRTVTREDAQAVTRQVYAQVDSTRPVSGGSDAGAVGNGGRA